MAQLIAAGAFATEGERRAAEVLQQLPNHWTVICNKILPRGDRSHEIDFIVIGKNWIFLLDEKSWGGRIQGNDQVWVRGDGFSSPSPLAKADYVAKILADHLRWKVTALKSVGHFVRGGILLSEQERLPQIHDSRASNGIYLLGTICERLQALDNKDGSPLVGQSRGFIQKALVDLSPRPQIPRRIDSVLIEDAISLRPGVRLFNGKIEGSLDRAVQLMVYDLTKDPLNADTLYDFYMRECKALQKLSSTGLVPTANLPYRWSEDFLVFPILPPRGEPLSVRPLPETREEFVQNLLLAAACFEALSQIHAHNILHRAIGPGAIYVQPSLKVAFTNFYAARLGDSSIAYSLDALAIEDPYAHLDLAIGYGYATPETDTFSLALVFLERLSGVSLSSIRANVESNIIFPQQQRWAVFLSADLAGELTELFRQAVMPDKSAQPLSAREISARLIDLAQRLSAEIQGNSVEGKILDRRYKVHRLLGRGTTACTYLASDIDFESVGLFALKQYLNLAEDGLKQVEAEFTILKNVSSRYLPRIFDIYPAQYDVHMKMEYIPGPTLQQVETEFPWSLERWWPFAQDLLNAVEVLEQHQLLHRDIKPANIILHDTENRPVLIDFGFAIRQGASGKFAGTPLYLPPETGAAGSNAVFPASCDRYAVGIVLFKALFGFMPFTLLGARRELVSLEQIPEKKAQRIAKVLLKVVSNDPGERPATIEQMRLELQTAFLTVEEPEQIHEASVQALSNAWVNEIRSLYRNSEVGNKNNRGLDSAFVQETYVPTALDERLLPAIFEREPGAIFLCGNPGDGKTAFLEKVQQELERRQARKIKQDPSGWEWELDGHTYRSCYDASEAHGEMNADQQLTEKLQGLQGDEPPAAGLTVLVAINDGRLADYFLRQQERFPWLAQQLYTAREKGEIAGLDVWVVDLKMRAFVNLPEARDASVFRLVLQRLVADEKWQICEGCSAQTVCPLRNNAQALRTPRVVMRLEYLFLLSHLRRQRHTTMRDLRSALAYLITGNKSCEQIHASMHEADAGASLVNISYWQSAFAPLERSDESLLELTPFDPARFPHPHLDRFLHFHQAISDAEQRRLLFVDEKDLAPQQFQDEAEWIAACKRRAYFEAAKAAQIEQSGVSLPKVRWSKLLPYQYAKLFMELLNGRLSDEGLQDLREELAFGILRSDGVMEDVPYGKLSVKVSASEEQQLVILKQLPLEEFELSVGYPHGTHMVECLPEIVVLQHRSGTPRLEITIDLFELLMRMAAGLQPTAPEFRPLLEDLRLFKDVLLLRETRDLVLIENQQRIHLITQTAGKIVRTRV